MKNRILLIFLQLLIILPLFSASVKNGRIIAQYIDKPPIIDGKIDAVYSSFTKIYKFYQAETGWGKPATEKTIAYIGFDRENLYIAAKCYDSQPQAIRANITRRENLDNSDLVILFLDTFNTRRRSFFFGFNPYGIQMDGMRDDENHRHDMDFSWDAFWYSQGRIYPWGYFVESKIPFKSLRFQSGKKQQEWGMILTRFIVRKGEFNTSVKIDRSIRGLLSQAASLVLNQRIKSGRNLEFTPTVTGLATSDDKLKPELGLSMKYGFTTNSTMDFTYNPDFSQIEADEGRVDINQRFALFFPERRPFFLEAKEIFDMPMRLFYSRRINSPNWGLKFTGRFGSSSLGLISSRDTASYEDLDDVSEGGEDFAQVNVFRYKYQVKDSSHVGMFMSHKRWNGKTNLVMAADTFLKFDNLAIKFQGTLSTSPEQTGNALNSSIGYHGKNFFGGVGYNQYSPDFDAQLGFIHRIDYRSYYIYSGYNFYPEKPALKQWGPMLFFTQNFDWQSGETVDRNLRLSLRGQSIKNSNFELLLKREYEMYEGVGYNKLAYGLQYRIDLSKFLSIGTNLGMGDSINYDEDDPFLGYSYSLSLFSSLNFLKRINLTCNYIGYYFYDQPGGSLDLKMNILRLKNTIFYTSRLSSRLIYELNDFYKGLYLSLLLSYELNPGTVFYLGASYDRFQEEDEPLEKTLGLFFKFSYFLRI